MQRKGFTLAELLAVVIILGVIALIVFPVVNRSIKQSRQKVYEEQKNMILKSAKNWSVDNVNELSFTDDTFLTLDRLMRDGYIEKKKVINPNTDKEMNGCVVISYNNTYNHFDYDYTDVSCEEMQDKPIITLNGENKVVVAIGQTYTDAGATAIYNGEDISNLIQVTNSVNTSVVGSYEVKYNVIYNGKKAKEVIRTVIVMDKNPVITLSPKQTNKYEKSVTVGVSVTVAEGNTISSMKYRLDGGTEQNVTNDKIVININGEHTIEVTVVDNEGNSKTVTSGTYKIDNTPPTITFAEGDAVVTLNVSEALNYNLLTGVTVTDNDSSVTIDDVVTSGSLDAVIGTYSVSYTITDEAGNTTTKDRTFNVIPSSYRTFYDIMNVDENVERYDPDSNLRYVGTQPNNYVWFNNELWRVIGLFNNQPKIIKAEYYLENILWSDAEVIDWSTSSLKTELNTTFLNSIDSTSKSYIDQSHVWKIGVLSADESDWTRYNNYIAERDSSVSWTGAIGLMYASDFGYSIVEDSLTAIGDSCDDTMFWSGGRECPFATWMFEEYMEWSLNIDGSLPFVLNYCVHYSRFSADPFLLNIPDWYLQYDSDYGGFHVRPVTYLKQEVVVIDGTGTDADPYELYMP